MPTTLNLQRFLNPFVASRLPLPNALQLYQQLVHLYTTSLSEIFIVLTSNSCTYTSLTGAWMANWRLRCSQPFCTTIGLPGTPCHFPGCTIWSNVFVRGLPQTILYSTFYFHMQCFDRVSPPIILPDICLHPSFPVDFVILQNTFSAFVQMSFGNQPVWNGNLRANARP